jgi:hypothetical protein
MSDHSRLFLALVAVAAAVTGCSGNDPVELTIDGPSQVETSSSTIRLTGRTFIPVGSRCPPSGELIVIGDLGPYEFDWSNDAAPKSGLRTAPGLWVCSSPNERESLHWTIELIGLAAGDNHITVTMSDSERTSSDSVTVTWQ